MLQVRRMVPEVGHVEEAIKVVLNWHETFGTPLTEVYLRACAGSEKMRP